MKRFLLVILLMIIIPFQLISLYSKNNQPGTVAGITEQQEVTNSASIGEYHFSLFGYTSPQAEVTFEGQGIYNQTTADNQGYFVFKNQFSPFSPREACLSAKDQLGRLSSPVCLPAFPTQYDITIGPVLIPPTVSLNNPSTGGAYYLKDEVVLSGQTIPNTDVSLSMFTKERDSRELRADSRQYKETVCKEDARNADFLSPTCVDESGHITQLSRIGRYKKYAFEHLILNLFNIIKPVEAFSFPGLTTTTDAQGNFSFSLPSSNPDKFHLFTQVSYNKNLSPESIKLNLQIYPWWMIIINFFLFIWSLIKSRLFEISILAEIVALTYYLIKHYFQPHAITLRKHNYLILEEHEIIKKDN